MPRSSKANLRLLPRAVSPLVRGLVERAHHTHAEEFYDCSTAAPTVAALGAELRAWEHTYNTVRPHQALGYRTPLESVTAWRDDQARKEALSRW